LTASSATNRTVQRAQPSGGSLQTIAMMRCFLRIPGQGERDSGVNVKNVPE
jgi:hypothetical protein